MQTKSSPALMYSTRLPRTSQKFWHELRDPHHCFGCYHGELARRGATDVQSCMSSSVPHILNLVDIHTAKAISAALASIFGILGSLDTCAPPESASDSRFCRPGTCRYRYHNIKNILYKLVLIFYLKFSPSSVNLVDSPR